MAEFFDRKINEILSSNVSEGVKLSRLQTLALKVVPGSWFQKRVNVEMKKLYEKGADVADAYPPVKTWILAGQKNPKVRVKLYLSKQRSYTYKADLSELENHELAARQYMKDELRITPKIVIGKPVGKEYHWKYKVG